MIAVLDASAAVRCSLDPSVRFGENLASADLVIAPELIVAELCSAFRKYIRAQMMSRADANQLTYDAAGLIDRFYPLNDLLPEVLSLQAGIDCSPYDTFYLALAKQHSATLFTADAALQKIARRLSISSM